MLDLTSAELNSGSTSGRQVQQEAFLRTHPCARVLGFQAARGKPQREEDPLGTKVSGGRPGSGLPILTKHRAIRCIAALSRRRKPIGQSVWNWQKLYTC